MRRGYHEVALVHHRPHHTPCCPKPECSKCQEGKSVSTAPLGGINLIGDGIPYTGDEPDDSRDGCSPIAVESSIQPQGWQQHRRAWQPV